MTADVRRRVRRALVVPALAALLAGGLALAPAEAHEDDGSDEDSAAHAREDLAGESMAQIERATAQNRRPYSALRHSQVSAGATGIGVSQDPGVSGRWSAVVPTPVVPVFQAVLPDGTVLMWDSVGTSNPESYPVQSSTRAMVWNPSTNSATRVDLQGFNIFCAGYAQLPDGDVLVVGGNKNADLEGLRTTHVFHWRTRTWTRGPDMSGERWYPAVAALANGEAVIVGGGPDRAEVYQADGTLRDLSGFSSFADRLYAMLVPRGDGRVELVGPGPGTATMTTTANGSLDAARQGDGVGREYGSFATYAPDRTLVTGGGLQVQPDGSEVPERSAVVVDTSGGATRTTPTSPMTYPRRQHNLTVLPDGSVLATGGMSRAEDGLVDLAHPVLDAENWQPSSGRWTTLAAAARVRQYHSSATLLPDGRVLTGGGGVCKTCVAKGYLEENLEYYSPPYLFRHDGTGRAAVRPALSGLAGSVVPGTAFTATSPAATSIRKVALVRLGAATHSIDQGQRYVPLSFTARGTRLSIRAPASNLIAPPGYYMLFAVDAHGVPSVARSVRVRRTGAAYLGNLSRGRTASQSSTWADGDTTYPAARAVDGTTNGALGNDSTSHTRADPWSWWQVDLGASRGLEQVAVWNRTDCCGERLADYWVFASDKPFDTSLPPAQQAKVAGVWSGHRTGAPSPSTTLRLPAGARGRYVMVQQGTPQQYLALSEVQVFGTS